jgi:predicted nucleic acid-binding protein
MTEHPIVCDTTILLYLGRVGRADLLPTLFSPVYVPEEVLLELDMGRRSRRDTVNPRDFAWATTVAVSQDELGALPPNRLGPGEQAVISYALHQGYTAGLDDLQAHLLAESLNITVVGTLGILLRAKQKGLISTVRPLMDAVIAQGFLLDLNLYQDVLRLANEHE